MNCRHGYIPGRVLTLFSLFTFSVTLNVYKVTGQFPWSSLRETDRGISAELSVNTPFYLWGYFISHFIQLNMEGWWNRPTNRSLRQTSPSPSFFLYCKETTGADIVCWMLIWCLIMNLSPQFPLLKTNQTLKWEGVWRELGCLARTASFAVREESGHSLKSSLSVFRLYCGRDD